MARQLARQMTGPGAGQDLLQKKDVRKQQQASPMTQRGLCRESARARSSKAAIPGCRLAKIAWWIPPRCRLLRFIRRSSLPSEKTHAIVVGVVSLQLAVALFDQVNLEKPAGPSDLAIFSRLRACEIVTDGINPTFSNPECHFRETG
jgi:hypothetical protein